LHAKGKQPKEQNGYFFIIFPLLFQWVKKGLLVFIDVVPFTLSKIRKNTRRNNCNCEVSL